jgi:enoyl-CoA hydratase/carnithine racemase
MALVEFEKKDTHLAVVTLNNPDRLNAFDIDMTIALREAWTKYWNDDDAWIAILTARGRAFTAGADKSWFDMALQGKDSVGIFQDLISKDPYWSGRLDKPVITAVNGFAIGAGLDLVLRSDLRVAGESVWFQQPEVSRGNIMVFFDGLPHAIAAEMIAGFPITSKRAYDVGMINRVVEDGKVMEAAIEIAEELLTRVPLALHHALKILRDVKNAATVVPRAMVDHYTTVLSKELMKTEDFKEATAALLQKTKPSFKKR